MKPINPNFPNVFFFFQNIILYSYDFPNQTKRSHQSQIVLVVDNFFSNNQNELAFYPGVSLPPNIGSSASNNSTHHNYYFYYPQFHIISVIYADIQQDPFSVRKLFYLLGKKQSLVKNQTLQLGLICHLSFLHYN